MSENAREELVHLAWLALEGSRDDVEMYVRRIVRRLGRDDPETAAKLRQIMGGVRRGNIARDVANVPVDTDTRLNLVRREVPVGVARPVWSTDVGRAIEQIVEERRRAGELAERGLIPTSSALFTGPPGVGKTLTARWIASQLATPLLVLDLSAVMSSYLGRTGNNLRNVLDYARGTDCVLMLDEFDAIAKRRDDTSEVGELKRLVTVLLQEIDTWPATGLLVCATNHLELLDPAVWRRFERVISFPMPDERAIERGLSCFLDEDAVDDSCRSILAAAFRGKSFSDIERELRRAR